VDNAVLVGAVDGPGQCQDQGCRRSRRLRRTVQLLGQAYAVHELQREVGAAILLPHIMDLHDIGVLQARHRLGFGSEAG
jgi:hypothetical protein